MRTIELNPVAFSPNLSRAVEISALGGHYIYVFSSDDYEGFEKDYRYLKARFKEVTDRVNFSDTESHINIELVKPDMSSLFSNSFESLSDVRGRVVKALDNEKVDKSINDTSYQLLKTAYDRLNLSAIDVRDIVDVAATIAKLENKRSIETHHLAEAVQYKVIN